MLYLPGLHERSILVLGDRDHLIEVSEDGIDVEDLDCAIDEEFWGKYCDIFIVLFASVICKWSGEEVGGRVCLSWGVFDLEVVVL